MKQLAAALALMLVFAATAEARGGRVVATGDSMIQIVDSFLAKELRPKHFRVKSDATQATTGTGLGLAITKSIVEAHGGRIRVESIEGGGTTFVVELPLARGSGKERG